MEILILLYVGSLALVMFRPRIGRNLYFLGNVVALVTSGIIGQLVMNNGKGIIYGLAFGVFSLLFANISERISSFYSRSAIRKLDQRNKKQ